jgi:hypothetical protein
MLIRNPPMLLAQEQPHPQWLSDFLAMVPWIVLFLFAWFFIYRFMTREKRRREELEAAKTHAAALQRQLDEVSKRSDPANRAG